MKKFTAYYADAEGLYYFAATRREINDTSVIIRHSKYGSWTEGPGQKGAVSAKAYDDGNGVLISELDNNKAKIRLDYSEAVELYMLLNELVRNTKLTSIKRILGRKQSDE